MDTQISTRYRHASRNGITTIKGSSRTRGRRLSRRKNTTSSNNMRLASNVRRTRRQIPTTKALLIIHGARRYRRATRRRTRYRHGNNSRRHDTRTLSMLRPTIIRSRHLVRFRRRFLPRIRLHTTIRRLFRRFMLYNRSRPHFLGLLRFYGLFFPGGKEYPE